MQISYKSHANLMHNIWKISGKSQNKSYTNPRQIFGKSKANPMQISGITQVYLKYNSGVSQLYLINILCKSRLISVISQANLSYIPYLWNFSGRYQVYLSQKDNLRHISVFRQISDNSLVSHVMPCTSQVYLRRISRIFQVSLRYISDISQAYLRNIQGISQQKFIKYQANLKQISGFYQA